ncbi:MAG TPA: hypothetical protein VMW91_10445 [Desulfosporosinus sp.]|nr:hypothetical protein [Desulfosporosinus sp.]
MNDLQDLYKAIIGLILIVASIALGIWLCLWVMLYGGIMQAIENWGINNSAVVWGIIKAVFFEIGLIPAYIGILVGMSLLK